MPLVRITLTRGVAAERRRAIADAVHEALVAAAGVVAEDRFQVVEEVEPANFYWNSSYLGIERTPGLVVIQVFLNVGRSLATKRALYAALAQGLARRAAVRPEDVLVNLVEVARENWSFGGGEMSYPPADDPA